MDLTLNGWLTYQTLACRVWARRDELDGVTIPAGPLSIPLAEDGVALI